MPDTAFGRRRSEGRAARWCAQSESDLRTRSPGAFFNCCRGRGQRALTAITEVVEERGEPQKQNSTARRIMQCSLPSTTSVISVATRWAPRSPRWPLTVSPPRAYTRAGMPLPIHSMTSAAE